MSEEKIKASAKSEFDLYMCEHRLRRTPERYAILEQVFSTAAHFSVEDLQAALEACGYHVSRATVYNTLDLLGDAGLVRRNIFGTGAPCYEKVTGTTKHFHLICTRCGKIAEIKDPDIERFVSERRYAKFHPLYADLNIYGLCLRCARKKKSSKPL